MGRYWGGGGNVIIVRRSPDEKKPQRLLSMELLVIMMIYVKSDAVETIPSYFLLVHYRSGFESPFCFEVFRPAFSLLPVAPKKPNTNNKTARNIHIIIIKKHLTRIISISTRGVVQNKN